MPISYAERKKRRQALLEGLDARLRDCLALRHVEAVAKLPIDAQCTLGEALSGGLRRIPAAIAHLQKNPQASVEDVLRASLDGRPAAPTPTVSKGNLSIHSVERDLDAPVELSELLRGCFPGMPAMTADALAADELFSEVLALVGTRQACFHSIHIHSELVFVALCGLALRFLDDLNRMMPAHPHYRAALAQSGLHHRMGWAEGQGSQGAREKSIAAPRPLDPRLDDERR